MTDTAKVLTWDEAKKEAVRCSLYVSGAYEYKTADGFWHIIINGVDVLKGKKAVGCHPYPCGAYKYQLNDGYWHLIINGVDVLEGKEAVHHLVYDSGAHHYQTADGVLHEVTIEKTEGNYSHETQAI